MDIPAHQRANSMHTETTSPVPHASNETYEAVRLALEAVRGLKERVKLAAPDRAIPAFAELAIKDWPWPYPAVFITENALIKRINRTLVWRAQRLIKSRGIGQQVELGDWFIIDLGTHSNPEGYDIIRSIRRIHDLESFGRELGCLLPWGKVRP